MFIKEHTEIFKKSKFIGLLYKINEVEEVTKILKDLKTKHKKATHITYAYIINNNEKTFDDKEPKNTAGLPILNVLKKNNSNNTLCVVIRYYGGIKLGTGGLIRAYSKTTNNLIKA